MKILLTLLATTLALAPASFAEDDPAKVAESTLVEAGQEAPAFTAELLGGGTFDLAAQRGRVVLVNWFATWCPPCRAEMPHLEKEVWRRFRDEEDFAMVSVAREETAKEVGPFVKQYGVTWPFALDPKREAYAKYATAYIPRNVVVDREGKIVYQSQGFERREFDAMIAAIAGELGVDEPRTSVPLKAHYAAVGAAEARYAITGISAEADCVSPRGAYTTTLKMAPRGRLVIRQEFAGEEASEGVLNGDLGWIDGEPIDDVGRWIAAGHAFQWMVLEVEDWFTGLEPAGEAEFGGTPCSVWTGRDFLDAENKLYFDKKSGLMQGLDLPDHFDREGRIQVYFEEWRTLDGVRLPDLVRITDGQDEFVLDFTEITLNDVDVAVFEGPGD